MTYSYNEEQLVLLEESVSFVSNFTNTKGDVATVAGNEKKTRALNELSEINLRREELIKIVLDNSASIQ